MNMVSKDNRCHITVSTRFGAARVLRRCRTDARSVVRLERVGKRTRSVPGRFEEVQALRCVALGVPDLEGGGTLMDRPGVYHIGVSYDLEKYVLCDLPDKLGNEFQGWSYSQSQHEELAQGRADCEECRNVLVMILMTKVGDG